MAGPIVVDPVDLPVDGADAADLAAIGIVFGKVDADTKTAEAVLPQGWALTDEKLVDDDGVVRGIVAPIMADQPYAHLVLRARYFLTLVPVGDLQARIAVIDSTDGSEAHASAGFTRANASISLKEQRAELLAERAAWIEAREWSDANLPSWDDPVDSWGKE